MEFSTLDVTLDGNVATIALNRPDKANAMCEPMWYEIEQAMQWLDETPEARVGVLVGRGPSSSITGAATGEDSRAVDVCVFGRVFVTAGTALDPASVRWITCDANGKAIAAVLGTHQVLGYLISPITVADGGLAEIMLVPHIAYAS